MRHEGPPGRVVVPPRRSSPRIRRLARRGSSDAYPCSLASLLGAFLCVSITHAGKDDAKLTDLDRLQGSWQMVLKERNGGLLETGTTSIMFKGDSVITLMNGKSVESGQMTLISGSPAQYDFKITADSDEIGHTFQGIYRIEGDTFQTCVNLKRDGTRPSRFSTEAGSETQMVVWRKFGTIPGKKP
ncbi:MAG: TIGR03067 domain-containing protein [Isosphaeraceae bacterium]